MDTQTAEILCKVTSDFYRAQAASFSATRTAPWHGWQRCVAAMTKAMGLSGEDGFACANGMRPAISVLDLACGNLRFERYLAEALSQASVRAYTVDSCDELAASASELNIDVTYESSDIVGGLIAGAPLCELHHAPQVDMAVSFGFLHHVPDERLRVRVLEGLIDAVRPGGCVAVSLWRFMSNPALAAKARTTHGKALASLGLAADLLDEGDYLLGWRDVENAWRYCHHFSDEEASRLAASVSDRARLIDSFKADGRTDEMNIYLVFQRNS